MLTNKRSATNLDSVTSYNMDGSSLVIILLDVTFQLYFLFLIFMSCISAIDHVLHSALCILIRNHNNVILVKQLLLTVGQEELRFSSSNMILLNHITFPLLLSVCFKMSRVNPKSAIFFLQDEYSSTEALNRLQGAILQTSPGEGMRLEYPTFGDH